MLETFEAIIDEHGNVRLLEAVQLPASRRALVTVLLDDSNGDAAETALLSEPALAVDWNRAEEDELIPIRPIPQMRGFLKGIDTTVDREVDRDFQGKQGVEYRPREAT